MIISEERIRLTSIIREFGNVGRKMRYVRYVVRSTYVKKRAAYQVLVGKSEGKRKSHLEDLFVDEKVILKLIFKKWDRGVDGFNLSQDRE